jgi:hypothetical protein
MFLGLFAMAISFTFLWTQNSENYVSATANTIAVENAQVSEQLIVNALNNTALNIENPTSQSALVTYVVSNNSVWTVNTPVAPFGNITLNLVNGSAPANGNFKVTTQNGNIFFGNLLSQVASAADQTWDVKWYWSTTSPALPTALTDLTGGTPLGESFWDKLSIDWNYGTGSPVVGTIAFAPNQMVGFVANTTLIKLSDNNSLATINYKIDNSSKIAFVIDGVLQDPLNQGNGWYDSTNYAWYTLNGTQGSYHVVTVYFYGYGNSSQQLYLNIVNATFAP